MNKKPRSMAQGLVLAGMALVTDTFGGDEWAVWTLMGLAGVTLVAFLPLGEWFDERETPTRS